MIPGFIGKQLSYAELEQFMRHIETCESCREELSIQFLVGVGLNSLEEGNTFDLQTELDTALEEAHRRVRMHDFLKKTLMAVEIVMAAAIFLVAIILLLL